MVLDCRHPLLPGVMNVTVMDLAAIQSSTMASEAVTVPPEREKSFGGGVLAEFDLSGVRCGSADRSWN